MLLYSSAYSQPLLFEGKPNHLHSNWKSFGVLHGLFYSLCKLVLPFALVVLLVFSHKCHGHAASSHCQNIPYKSVGGEERYLVISSMVCCLCAKARGHNKIKVVFTPIFYPLCSKLISSSNFLQVFMCTKLFNCLHQNGHSRLHNSNQKFDDMKTITSEIPQHIHHSILWC